MMITSTLIMQVLTPVLTALVSAVAVQLVNYLAQHIGIKKLQRLQETLGAHKALIDDVVKFVQQRYASCDGQTKLKLACDAVSKQLDHYGLKLTSDQIELAIESSLKTMKMTFGDAWYKEVQQPQDMVVQPQDTAEFSPLPPQ